MCTTCLLFSALMLFTPAENAAPVNGVSVAQETQVAITQMVKQLPKSSDTTLLRSGLLELHSQLATTKNDAQAQQIIDSELNVLSQQINNSSSGEEVTELLEDMLIEDEPEPLVKSLNKSTSKPTWGWLR
ncbi:hypothetical protein [Synechocystis sp. PCC 7509]|uniref:hypothetical protein n=1 Tax=Synechocystis sp. PCC 7509 TaxID=927677 RepID=UPI0002ABC7EA|nr:hypothetical protein [Synechocystis sp. PCC 7509]